MSQSEIVFTTHRDTLVGVAYRMLGQVADAEDVVQEAWLRWADAPHDEVRDAKAYLVRVTARLALDRLRRVKARRESYYGEWLPEPIPTGGDLAEDAVLSESVSVALMVVLETLSPLERAVFVLREAFGFSHAEIAETLDRSEAAVRQLARRARDHVRERRPRFDVDRTLGRDVTQRFLAASAKGDLDDLMRILAPGVELVADGGGRVRAPLLPVRGADKVARFLVAAAGRPLPDQRFEMAELNGGPAIVVRSGSVAVAAVFLETIGGSIERIYLVGNPEKLASIGASPV